MNTTLILQDMDVDVVITLITIGNRISHKFQGKLVVGRYQAPGDYYTGDYYTTPRVSYYFLAEQVKKKLLGFIPRTRKRVLVSMSDPHPNYGEVVCLILDVNAKNVAEEEVRRHAQAVGATKVTILDNDVSLVI